MSGLYVHGCGLWFPGSSMCFCLGSDCNSEWFHCLLQVSMPGKHTHMPDELLKRQQGHLAAADFEAEEEVT